MKKLLTISLLVIISILITGCSDKSNNNPNPNPSTQEKETETTDSIGDYTSSNLKIYNVKLKYDKEITTIEGLIENVDKKVLESISFEINLYDKDNNLVTVLPVKIEEPLEYNSIRKFNTSIATDLSFIVKATYKIVE